MNPSFFMNEQDLKYLISSYQTTCSELFTQSIATNAKVRQLTDIVESLTAKVKEQQEELESLKQKPKRITKSNSSDFQ